jgi:hypothetical protein
MIGKNADISPSSKMMMLKSKNRSPIQDNPLYYAPAGQMEKGGIINSYNSLREMLESIRFREGVSDDVLTLLDEILQYPEINEISMDNPVVSLLNEKLEKHPLKRSESKESDEDMRETSENVDLLEHENLRARLRVIDRMLEKNPNNQSLITRKKVVTKMLEKKS